MFVLAILNGGFDGGHEVFGCLANGEASVEELFQYAGVWTAGTHCIDVDIGRSDETHQNAGFSRRRNTEEEDVGVIHSTFLMTFGYLDIDVGQRLDDFITLFRTLPKVDAGLAASIFHFGEVKIDELKREMAACGIPARIAASPRE